MSSEPVSAYRLSDAERDEAISALADAYVDGRLDAEEFERRMASASGATYAGDLDPLFADLPARRAAVEPVRLSRRRSSSRRGPRPWVILAVAVLAVLLVTAHGWLLFGALFLILHGRNRRRSSFPHGDRPMLGAGGCGFGYRSSGSRRPVETL